MTQTYIYAGLAFTAGFIGALVIYIIQMLKMRRSYKSLEGFFEAEKLIRERLQKENVRLHEIKEAAQNDYELKIQQLESCIKTMDEDILLLQKSNEETEELLKITNPMVHSLKLKLIEANNAIARYKGQGVLK